MNTYHELGSLVRLAGGEHSVRRSGAIVTIDSSALLTDDPMSKGRISTAPPRTMCGLKDQQSAKIRELGHALIASGVVTLEDQAAALGLPRSTTWTILKGNHKSSGLSAGIVNRMLESRQLPSLARSKLLEYIDCKAAGLFGHNEVLRRRFISRISEKSISRSHLEGILKGIGRIPQNTIMWKRQQFVPAVERRTRQRRA
jgi:hypothetical protein